ncbi:ABC transporter ATP-binding protein [Candidatus Aerophobetes bacterium]|nr:ABC transporter ATP-binding protein [Candidatus Aerophobetes bacterium]
MLSTVGLSKYFGGIKALHKLDMVVEEGQIHGLIGPNGAGKTTFFNMVSGLLPLTEGKIYFNSVDISNIPAEDINKMGISRTFQAGKLVPNMTVLDNVMSGMYNYAGVNPIKLFFLKPFTLRAQEEEIKQQALKTLKFIGMSDSAERWASELVWVERQLVQIARALVTKPKLLMLDEPTSGMGIEESKKVEGIIRQVRDMGITVIVISHDVKLVVNLSDWVTALNFGEKISEGTPQQIQNDSKVLEAYLGEEKK